MVPWTVRDVAIGLMLAVSAVAPPGPAMAGGMGGQVPEVAAAPVTESRYPLSEVAFADGVTGRPGVSYATLAGFRPLMLDLYLPPGSAERGAAGFPLVIYVHGGGGTEGDARRNGAFADFPGVLASLAARGFVVASIDYRLSGEAQFPAPIQDVKAAVRWLRGRAADFAIDPGRVAVWGASAGGHLAALEPGRTKPATPDAKPDGVSAVPDPAPVSDCVQAAVSWYGVFDIATIAAQARRDDTLSRDKPDAPEWRLLGCFADACKDGRISSASPATYIDARDPPMLLVVGTGDRIVPHQQSLDMAEKLKLAGVAHELLALPDVDHGLIGRTPDETRDAHLKALASTFAFFDRLR